MRRLLPGILLIMSLLFHAGVSAQSGELDEAGFQKSKLSYWAYEVLNLPDLSGDLLAAKGQKENDPIIIAVIDDAFRLTHKDLKDYIYQNPIERDKNGIDDDGNGKADDLHGWDISDNDNDVNPPAGREESYFHGTFISGSIITILQKCFGDAASEKFKILPVKVLSDHSDLPVLNDGYKGISYAIQQGADIICCAWSGGQAGSEERAIIEEARNAGIVVIGSAGNYYTEKVDAPAALEGVIAVAGVDTAFMKTIESNYGVGIDLAAPAVKIRAAHADADNAYFYGSGTSGACGLVTGCMAVLKALHQEATPQALQDALINTSTPLEHLNLSYSGKLGAGLPNLIKAVSFLEDTERRGLYFCAERPMGKIYLSGDEKRNSNEIRPRGAYHGFNFSLIRDGKVSSKQMLSFYSGDSIFYQSSLAELPPGLFIPGSRVRLEYTRGRGFGIHPPEIVYRAMPIDSSTLFCSDISYYSLDSAVINDGSGAENYANKTSCKWQIRTDEGSRVQIQFQEFDTEAKVDFVYLFDGESTLPENLIAKFSGPNIPPAVTSRTNNVLIWFVSDGRVTKGGWRLEYRAVLGP